MTDSDFKSGFVTIIGRPNVGKSTLLNRLVRQKIAIVSDKPQTTRHRISAVVNRPGSQMIFMDTPGLHRPKDHLGERLNQIVISTLGESDVNLFLMDAAAGVGKGDEFIAKEIAKGRKPAVAALNKIDLVDKDRLETEIENAANLSDFEHMVKISAITGEGVDNLIDILLRYLELGPRYFPEGMISDQPEKILISEFIREKVLELTREEIPYSVAVEIEEMKKRHGKDLIDVTAWVYVERDSQKGILIGRGGEMIKEIGVRARTEIQKLLGSQIFIDLRVKVKKRWRRDNRLLDELGY